MKKMKKNEKINQVIESNALIDKKTNFLDEVISETERKKILEIDRIVKECNLNTCQETGILRSLKIAYGMDKLRKLFDSDKIKKLVWSLKDSPLGFLTDRSEKTLLKAKLDGKPLKPYTYDEIRDALIVGMLRGYRMTGGEITIISANFYANACGKFRRIREKVFNYHAHASPPIISGNEAKLRCSATFIDPASGKKNIICEN